MFCIYCIFVINMSIFGNSHISDNSSSSERSEMLKTINNIYINNSMYNNSHSLACSNL